MKNSNGFTMPGTMVFSFVLFSFLIHFANLYVLEKKFYAEGEEMLHLDILMNNGIKEVKRNTSDSMHTTYQYEQGEARIEATGSPVMYVTIICKTRKSRTYKASFQYNKDTQQITRWFEER